MRAHDFSELRRVAEPSVRLRRAWFIIASLILVWLSAPAISSAEQTSHLPTSPNLLLIVADDHAAWTLGIDGDPRRATPNLDALARQGALFQRAYCNSPLCTPSRQSLITGKLPHAIGVTQLATRLSDDILTLGDWFHDLDFATAAIGKLHFNGPSAHGFGVRIDTPDWERSLREHQPRGGDRRRPWWPLLDPAREWLNADARPMGLPAESTQSTFFVDRAIAFLKEKRNRPFAMIVSFYEPHSPFHFPEGWSGRFRPNQFDAFTVSEQDRRQQPEIFTPLSDADVKGIQAAYFTSLSFVDSRIGRLIEALDQSRLSDKTLVVYVGDNGYMLGQHGRFEKHCFFEPAVRIPMIMRWPGHVESGRRVMELVEMVDVMPTVLHLMHLPVPPDLQGVDLEPLLKKKPGATGHDVVFSEYLENEEAMVRSARYKLIVCTGRRQREDGYKTAEPWRTPGPYMRFYDLVNDPDETTDLSEDAGRSSIKDELLLRMYERMATTRDGLEPIPSGLSRLEAIHWCLVPRDRREIPPQVKETARPPASTTRKHAW
jgi:arylsulfatase A-like enzyme